MQAWLEQINPNALVVGLLVGALTWAYRKFTGDSNASLIDALGGVIKQEVHRLLEDPATIENARASLESAAAALLARARIARSKPIDLLVTAAIEGGLAELAEQLGALKRITEGVGKLTTATEALKSSFAPPASPTVPVLQLQLEQDPDK
jgi:hypothetical protein